MEKVNGFDWITTEFLTSHDGAFLFFFCILFLQDTAGQPAGHDNPPSIDIKSGSCEVNVTNDAHTLIGESHQEVLLLQEMILDFSRK